jgi:hypothetical protein
VAAAARPPASRRLGVDNAPPWTAPRVLGSVLGAQVVNGSAGGGGALAAAAMARRTGTTARGWRGWRGRTRRPFIRATWGDGVVTTGSICRATAPRPVHVRPAPRTDRGSAALKARVRRRGDATRGVLGRGEHREVWASGSARPRADEASGRRAGMAIEGRATRGAWARDVAARWHPA